MSGSVNITKEQVLRWADQWYHTSRGHREITEQMERDRTFVPEYADGAHSLRRFHQIQRVSEMMADILFQHITHDTITQDQYGRDREGLSEFSREDIHIHYHAVEHGGWEANISFDADKLKRKSLDPENYEGVQDVIYMFVHGYDYKGGVSGVWEGHGDEPIFSLRHREGIDFVTAAVKDFQGRSFNNKPIKKITTITVADEYVKNK